MQLNFPSYNFKIKREENANYVFDIIRKKYVILTKEELVRQHLIAHLIGPLGYPPSLLAVERGITINQRRKRFDLMAFDSSGNPLLLVECKAPDILLSNETLLQIAIYNSHFNCKHLLVSNGLKHVWIQTHKSGNPIFKEFIPSFQELI